MICPHCNQEILNGQQVTMQYNVNGCVPTVLPLVVGNNPAAANQWQYVDISRLTICSGAVSPLSHLIATGDA